MSLIYGSFAFFQEAIVTSEEIGKDYEHVEAQQKKFDDFEKVCGLQFILSLSFLIRQHAYNVENVILLRICYPKRFASESSLCMLRS